MASTVTLSKNGAILSWWSKAANTNNMGIFSYQNTGSYYSHIEIRSNMIFAETKTNCNNFHFNNLAKTIDWTFYTIVFDNLHAYLYVNGTFFNEADDYGNVPCGGAPVYELVDDFDLRYIGVSTTYSNGFNGIIDDVRIYGEALSSAQIKKLYVEGAKKHGLLVEN